MARQEIDTLDGWTTEIENRWPTATIHRSPKGSRREAWTSKKVGEFTADMVSGGGLFLRASSGKGQGWVEVV